MVGSFHNTHYNCMLKCGRTRPVASGPHMQLSHYLLRNLPAPPLGLDYSHRAALPLSKMYLNDALGDCVIACMAHMVGVYTANANNPVAIFSDAGIIQLYSAIGGYVPGNPATDNGCNEQTALNYWMRHGAGSHRIGAWLKVNPADPVEVKTAIWLFECIMFGMELPDAWLDTRPGFVWGPGNPDPANGHCVAGCGYSNAGVHISTWGMQGTITWDAIRTVVTPANYGELYVALSPDVISRATRKSPAGLLWPQLTRDFQMFGAAA